MYGCGILICLSGGFYSVVIFSSSIEVQSWIGMFTNWCSHEFILGLIVIIKANNILDSGCYLFLCILLSVGNF